MKRVKAIKDEEIQFEVVIGEENGEPLVVKEFATEILILWDEVRQPGQTLQDRYTALAQALSYRWGGPVSHGTTFLVLDEAFRLVAELKNAFARAQLEAHGISTDGKSSGELSLLYSLLPRIESYREMIDRRAQGDMNSDRAYQMVLDITDDEVEAARASAAVTFATTPLG